MKKKSLHELAAEGRALLRDVTPGYWRPGNQRPEVEVIAHYPDGLAGHAGERLFLRLNEHFASAADVKFIASMREYVPALLQAIDDALLTDLSSCNEKQENLLMNMKAQLHGAHSVLRDMLSEVKPDDEVDPNAPLVVQGRKALFAMVRRLDHSEVENKRLRALLDAHDGAQATKALLAERGALERDVTALRAQVQELRAQCGQAKRTRDAERELVDMLRAELTMTQGELQAKRQALIQYMAALVALGKGAYQVPCVAPGHCSQDIQDDPGKLCGAHAAQRLMVYWHNSYDEAKRKLSAFTECPIDPNPVQTHTIEIRTEGNVSPFFYTQNSNAIFCAKETGGKYVGWREIGLTELVHLILNVTADELRAIVARPQDYEGKLTGPAPGESSAPCPHQAVAGALFCNACQAVKQKPDGQ